MECEVAGKGHCLEHWIGGLAVDPAFAMPPPSLTPLHPCHALPTDAPVMVCVSQSGFSLAGETLLSTARERKDITQVQIKCAPRNTVWSVACTCTLCVRGVSMKCWGTLGGG